MSAPKIVFVEERPPDHVAGALSEKIWAEIDIGVDYKPDAYTPDGEPIIGLDTACDIILKQAAKVHELHEDIARLQTTFKMAVDEIERLSGREHLLEWLADDDCWKELNGPRPPTLD